jgi:hypothetical protein
MYSSKLYEALSSLGVWPWQQVIPVCHDNLFPLERIVVLPIPGFLGFIFSELVIVTSILLYYYVIILIFALCSEWYLLYYEN